MINEEKMFVFVLCRNRAIDWRMQVYNAQPASQQAIDCLQIIYELDLQFLFPKINPLLLTRGTFIQVGTTTGNKKGRKPFFT